MFFVNFIKLVLMPWRFFTMNKGALRSYIYSEPCMAGMKISTLWNSKDKGDDNIIRVANKLIKTANNPSGLFRRNELITLFNPEANQYVCGFARGCGSMKLFNSTVVLDYDQRLHLGVSKDESKGDFRIWKASRSERNHFFNEQIEDPLQRNLFRIEQRNFWVSLLMGIFLATGSINFVIGL